MSIDKSHTISRKLLGGIIVQRHETPCRLPPWRYPRPRELPFAATAYEVDGLTSKFRGPGRVRLT